MHSASGSWKKSPPSSFCRQMMSHRRLKEPQGQEHNTKISDLLKRRKISLQPEEKFVSSECLHGSMVLVRGNLPTRPFTVWRPFSERMSLILQTPNFFSTGKFV
jgi:hypothetical protein